MTDSAKSIKKATVQGAVWNYATFIGSKGLVFITGVILARLLSPYDFGLLAVAMILITYLDTVDGLGVADAMIYRQNDPERAYSVAFYMNLFTGIVLAFLGFLAAPLAALFFKEPRVTPILQVLALAYLVTGIGSLFESRFRKELDFRSKFLVQVGKAVIKGSVSITLALTGFGVWSLVWGQLAGAVSEAFLYWVRKRWWPQFIMDWTVVRSLWGFGFQMFLVDVLGMIHKNVDYLIVGRLLGAEQLGLYTMGFRLPELVIINICYIFGQTLFPAYAKLQGNLSELRAGYLRSVEYLCLFTMPAGILMFLIAPEFVLFFYGAKWFDTIAVVQALSIYAVIYSLSFNAGDIYKAMGKPVILNVMGIVKLAVTVPALLYAAQYGIFYVALAQVFTTIILTIVRLVVACRIIGMGWQDLIHAYRPAAIASLVMMVVMYFVRQQILFLPALANMILVGLFGLLLYLGILWLTNRSLILQIYQTIATAFLRRASKPTESA